MASTGERRLPAAGLVVLPRRRVLAALAAIPVGLTLAACTDRGVQPQPSGSSPTASGGSSTTPTTDPPAVDAPALEAAAVAAMTLLAAYEATVAAHPALGPVLAPYADDHHAHLEALGQRITLPTPQPPTAGPTSTAPTVPTVPTVPADPAAARAALVQAEASTGEAARDAARSAHDGEAARLLASIGASRAVHALLLGAPA